MTLLLRIKHFEHCASCQPCQSGYITIAGCNFSTRWITSKSCLWSVTAFTVKIVTSQDALVISAFELLF